MPDSPASASRELRLKVCTITSRLYANPGPHVPQAKPYQLSCFPGSEPAYFFVVFFFFKFGLKGVHFPATKLQFCRLPSNPSLLLDTVGLLGGIIPVFFFFSQLLFVL